MSGRLARSLVFLVTIASSDLVLASVNIEIKITGPNGDKATPNKPSTIWITPYDDTSGPIEWATLYPEHERRLHVIIASHSLEFFSHIHPEDYNEFKPWDVGPFPVQQILPYEGSYIVIVELTLSAETDECEGGMPETETFTKAQVFEIGSPIQPLGSRPKGYELEVFEARLGEGGLPIADNKIVHHDPIDQIRGSSISVKPDIAEGGHPLFESDCIPIRLSFTRKGVDFKDLRPYLSAVGHITLIPFDWDGADSNIQHLHASATSSPAPCSSGGMQHAMDISESFGPDVFFDIRIPRSGKYGLFFETTTSQSYLMIKLYLDIQPLSLSVRQPSLSTEFYEITWPEEVVPASSLAVVRIPPSHGELEKEAIHDRDSYSRVKKLSGPMIVQGLFTKIRQTSTGSTTAPVLMSTLAGSAGPENLFDSPYELPLLKNDPTKAFELGSGKIKSDGAEYRVLLSLDDGMNAFSNSCVKVSAKVIKIMDGRQTAVSFQHSQTMQLFQGPRLIILGEIVHTITLLPQSSAFEQRLYAVDDKCSVFANGEAMNMAQDGEASENVLGYFNVGDTANVSIYFQATIPDGSMATSEGIVEGFRVNLCQTKSTLLWEDPCTWSVPPAADRDVSIPANYHVEIFGDKLRQIEIKTLTIRGKLSIHGNIDILADRILIIDGGHLDVKGGLVNFLLTGNAIGNPFCYRSRLEESGSSIIIRGGYFTANWESDGLSSPLLIGTFKEAQERGSRALFVACSGELGRSIYQEFKGSIWFRDDSVQQLQVHVIGAERKTGLGGSSIWKLLLASPLPRDVPQGSIFAQKEAEHMTSIKRLNSLGNNYPLLVMKEPQPSVGENNKCKLFDLTYGVDIASKPGRRHLLHSARRDPVSASKNVFDVSIAGAGVPRPYKTVSLFEEARSSFQGSFLSLVRNDSSASPSWPAILLIGNKINFEGHDILIERPSGPCITAKGGVHFDGKSVLCTLSSSDGIEVDLTGSTSPWAFFKLTDAVVVGNSGRGMYIQGTDSNQVSIESCVSLWNDGADYEWGGTAHHSQTVKSSIFKNCQSTFNRHSGGASRYRENILDQTARQSRKAHKKKPHAPLSAGLGNQNAIQIHPLASYLDQEVASASFAGTRRAVGSRELAFFAIDITGEFAAVAIKFKIFSKGAIVVALSAFGGIPYLPGFDVGDYSSSQLRTPKKPFDFAKVIDSGGSLNEIVWTNPVYNTGIWYLAVGGKDGIAADFEIKIVASGQCLPGHTPYWTGNPMSTQDFYKCKDVQKIVPNSWQNDVSISAQSSSVFLVEVPPDTVLLYVEMVRKARSGENANGGGAVIFKARRNTLPIMKGADQALFSVEGIFRGEVPDKVFDSSRFASRITVPPGQYYLQVFYIGHDEDSALVDFFVGLDTCASGSSIIPVFTPSHHQEDFIRDAQELPQCQPCQAAVNRLEPGILFERDESFENKSLKGRSAYMDMFQISVPRYSQSLSIDLSDVPTAVILHFKHETMPLQVDSEDYLSFLDDYSVTLYPGKHQLVVLDAFRVGGRHGDWYISLEFASKPRNLSYKILAQVQGGPSCLGSPECLGRGLCQTAPSQTPCACLDAYEGEFCSRSKDASDRLSADPPSALTDSALPSIRADDTQSPEYSHHTSTSANTPDSASNEDAQVTSGQSKKIQQKVDNRIGSLVRDIDARISV